jgi:hypothetical protein
MAIHIPSQNGEARNTAPQNSRKPEYGTVPRPSLNSPERYLLNQNQQYQEQQLHPQLQPQPYPQTNQRHHPQPYPQSPVYLADQSSQPPKLQSRFRCKNEISAYLLIANPNHGQWLISKADHVCEETLMVLLSAKNAKVAFLSFGAATVKTQQELWDKVTAIKGHCNASVQAHWVKSVTAELSRYWTAVLRKAGNSVLPSEQHGEFTHLIDEAHKLTETQADEAGKTFMTTQQITTLDQLAQLGASVTTTFPTIDLSNSEKEAMMKASEQTVSNEPTPFPNIDPAMLNQDDAVQATGTISRTIAAVKAKTVEIKNTVVKFIKTNTFSYVVISICLLAIYIALRIIIRRSVVVTPAQSFAFSGTLEVIGRSILGAFVVARNYAAFVAGVVYETIKIASAKTGHVVTSAFNAIKGWFVKSGDVLVDAAAPVPA